MYVHVSSWCVLQPDSDGPGDEEGDGNGPSTDGDTTETDTASVLSVTRRGSGAMPVPLRANSRHLQRAEVAAASAATDDWADGGAGSGGSVPRVSSAGAMRSMRRVPSLMKRSHSRTFPVDPY